MTRACDVTSRGERRADTDRKTSMSQLRLHCVIAVARRSVAGSVLAEQIEPATPPASLQRDDAAAATMQSTLAWEGYPQVNESTQLLQQHCHYYAAFQSPSCMSVFWKLL